MEGLIQWLSSQGPLGMLCLALLYTCRTLYADLQKSHTNERNALLRLLQKDQPESLE